ncbi:MAG: carotenoid oxygenase family protein [Scytonema sp. PMC 1069.18]|nr:carotenoid oxygenase family protein [Scytonema sp. PMC 1069.18]MEC4886053.1 carotenoid oxygenase family protein [Scytonema sp. PMC 1070.18]
MHTIDQKSTKKAWAQAIAHPAQEFSPTQLQVLSGKLPDGLVGTLYRNGPARLERGGIHVGHWFDGDGAILAVNFSESGVTTLYRYVQTIGYREEAAAGQLLYGNYGMTAPGPLWNKWFKATKNSANTNVLALPDKLLALWEGGKPYALDLQSLDTWGEENLSGLTDGLTYSAHYKRDPQTGEIFNFGITPGLNATLNLYKSDSTGKIVQKAAHNLEGVPLVHDFVFAGQYLVFFIPPVRLNLLPTMIGMSDYGHSLEWIPQKGTQILVIDRQTLQVVSRGEAEPWFQWHFANGYVDASGSVIVDVVRYPDFQTNQYLREVATGDTHTCAVSTLWRMSMDPILGKVKAIEEIVDRHCEFPVVPPQHQGQKSHQTYLTVHRQGVDSRQELFGAIARFDHNTDTLTIAECGENRYPSEAIYVPSSQNPDRGWVITVVYDGNCDRSEVWVYDADRLDDSPICKLALPSVIPHSFHGTWKNL